MIPSAEFFEFDVEELEIDADLRVVGAMANRQSRVIGLLEALVTATLLWFADAVGKRNLGKEGSQEAWATISISKLCPSWSPSWQPPMIGRFNPAIIVMAFDARVGRGLHRAFRTCQVARGKEAVAKMFVAFHAVNHLDFACLIAPINTRRTPTSTPFPCSLNLLL